MPSSRDLAEAIKWMRSRPAPIQALMRQFPPACTVKLTDNVHLCDNHEHLRGELWRVASYTDAGSLGIVPDNGPPGVFSHAMPDELIIVAFCQGQDHAFVERVLNGAT